MPKYNQGPVPSLRGEDMIHITQNGREMRLPVSVVINHLTHLANTPSPSVPVTLPPHTHDYSSLTNKPVLFSGSYNDLTNRPAARSQASATRALNSPFQISTTRDAQVAYSVEIAAVLSLSVGQQGAVVLEMASNIGFTTDVQELGRFVNGNTGTLSVGFSLTQNVAGTVIGYVPAGRFVRLRTVNLSGTPVFNYRTGQEVLL